MYCKGERQKEHDGAKVGLVCPLCPLTLTLPFLHSLPCVVLIWRYPELQPPYVLAIS